MRTISPSLSQMHRFTKKSVLLCCDFVVAYQIRDKLCHKRLIGCLCTNCGYSRELSVTNLIYQFGWSFKHFHVDNYYRRRLSSLAFGRSKTKISCTKYLGQLCFNLLKSYNLLKLVTCWKHKWSTWTILVLKVAWAMFRSSKRL